MSYGSISHTHPDDFTEVVQPPWSPQEGYLKLNLAALLRDLPAGAPPVEPAGSVHAAAAAAAARSANRNRNARANGNAANSAAGAAAPSGPATSAPTQAQAQAPNPAAGTAAAAPTTSDADADPDPIVEYDVGKWIQPSDHKTTPALESAPMQRCSGRALRIATG